MFDNPIWGARLMPWDIPAALACALATAWAWPFMGTFSLLGPLVLGHFFLFCNVFRVRRSLELVWSALFLTNAAVCVGLFAIDALPYMALAQLPFTAIVIGFEVRDWRYHGIFADHINPDLTRYVEWRSGS